MQQHQRQFRRESAKKQKRRRDDTALTNVLSLRISDQEKRTLEKIMKATSKNVSEVVREAIFFWLGKRQRLGFE